MVLSTDRWKGKVAIVTGASSGCGAAIAELLVRHGINVVGLARRYEKVEELSEKLKGQPGSLYAFKADISKVDDIKAAFEWTKSHLGNVSILVNNAGFAKLQPFLQVDPQTFKNVLDTNVFGLAVATQEAIKDMTANKVDGHIININSILGHQVFNIPNLNIYYASKFAVTALTETLRQELNRADTKIKVTSVSPGLVNNEFLKGDFSKEEFESFSDFYPMLQCEDVADAVIYALSTPPHVQIHEVMMHPVGKPV